MGRCATAAVGISSQGVTASQPESFRGWPKFATASPSCGGPSLREYRVSATSWLAQVTAQVEAS